MPVVVSTWSFSARGNTAAWDVLTHGGSSLDAVERACVAVEEAPDVDSVGFGGLPDSSGRMSLDACVMLSPARCGAACALRSHLHATSVARLVMERTRHVMLVGSDADDFADASGLPRSELLAPTARLAWERWRASPHEVDQGFDRSLLSPLGLRPTDGGSASDGRLFGLPSPGHDEHERRWRGHDTIGTLCLDAHGVMAGACSTSGTPFKLPGRVGDSPIVGHGLYVDPSVGGATATGAGELVMGVCGSFLAVESMRAGRPPLEAVVTVLDRIRGAYALEAHHQVAMLAMRADGAWASASLRPGFLVAARDDAGERLVPPDAVLLPEGA